MIALNDFRRQWHDVRDAAFREFNRVGESGRYILGSSLEIFERALASLWRLRHCIGVASGLDAIEIALRALGCRTGDRVLTTPVSAFATTLAIVKLGAVPVFVDVDDSGLIDLDACEGVLSSRGDVKFFLPVHLFGHALNGKRLRHLRTRYGLILVEDCAQSIGADSEGEPAGTSGQCCATSFYPTKNLGAMGDGGAILTSDDALQIRIRALRDYGQTGKYRHEVIGYNSRLDELQAGLLAHVFLPRLEAWTARRRVIARMYVDSIHNPALRIPEPPLGSRSVWHLFPVVTPPARKMNFRAHLAEHDIASGEHYPIAIPDQSALSGVVIERASDLACARRFCSSEVTLPVHPYLTDTEVSRVIEVCNGWPG
ncbi:MAG TPA: DegT/DnrJ/EryC1/StrS family aminotransferase [Bryobacteraceae bacterium]|nr:DegT/DnrJ/EryC1/StrS family aminotransferase [Bryobacteraceae bacterium]